MLYVLKGNNLNKLKRSTQLTGEKTPNEFKEWDYFSSDPNEILRYSYDIVSQRSTTLYHTYGPVSSAINKTTAYTIGPGLRFKSQPDYTVLGISQDKARDWARAFEKQVHYIFNFLNFYEKQSTVFRTAAIQGDSLFMFDKDSNNSFGLDLIDVGGDQITFDYPYSTLKDSRQEVSLGIIHDNLLRRKGVILKNEPVLFKDENNDQNILQIFEKQMSRQLRGYPLAYKIISVAKNHDRFYDATLQRAVLESIILGYTEGESTDNPYRQMESLAKSSKEDKLNSSDANFNLKNEGNIAATGPGNLFTFSKGGGVKFTDLKTPSNNFDIFNEASIDLVGMATDVPSEVIKSKYSTSYTAHKGALNDFIKMTTLKRRNFTNNVCKPVLIEIAKFMFMQGIIAPPSSDFFTNPITQEATIAGNWVGPVPGHINPLQEVNAKKIEVEEAFKTRSEAASEYGNDYDNMISEWAEQEKEYKNLSAEDQMNRILNDLDNMDLKRIVDEAN